MFEFIVGAGGALAIIGTVVYAYFRDSRVRLTPRQYDVLYSTAQMAVAAAEQLGKAFPEVKGDSKYAFVESVVKDAADRLGVKLSGNQVVAFVHAALKELEDSERAADLLSLPDLPGLDEAV